MDQVDLEPHHTALLNRLYGRAGAERWGVDRATFVDAMGRSAANRFRDGNPTAAAVASYLESLHVDDLALARACAAGQDVAWEHFIGEQRPGLYRAATAIARADGRELADSLYADLFGLTERDGQRRSLLDYFHGRSSLATWLRAVLAQRHVDAVRAARRVEPFDEGTARPTPQATTDPRDLDHARLTRALHGAFASAVGALDPGEALRLACYYREQLTLAQIGRLLGEHEATVSRKLARARKRLRRDIEARLRNEYELSDIEIDRCVELTAEPWHYDETRGLGKVPAEHATDASASDRDSSVQREKGSRGRLT